MGDNGAIVRSSCQHMHTAVESRQKPCRQRKKCLLDDDDGDDNVVMVVWMWMWLWMLSESYEVSLTHTLSSFVRSCLAAARIVRTECEYGYC